MNLLLIDTSSNREIIVRLIVNGEKFKIKRKIGAQKAQVVLQLIDELLRRRKLKIRDITGIEVNTGPGSFTGLRVGVSIANAMGFFLKIPINRKKVGKLVEPKYK